MKIDLVTKEDLEQFKTELFAEMELFGLYLGSVFFVPLHFSRKLIQVVYFITFDS